MYNYSIKTILRKDKKKKNGRCPLNLILTTAGKQYKLPTAIDVEEEYWDKEKEHLKKGAHDFGLKNGRLQNLRSKLNIHVNELILSGNIHNAELLKNYMNKDKKVVNDFYQYFEKQIQLWKSSKRQSTLEGYKHSLSVLKQFKPKLNFTDITLTFVKGYEQYLRQVRKVEDGGSFNRHKHLRAVIREAIREKKMGENPYANGNFKIKKGENKTRFLTIEEMKAIEKMSIPAKRVRLQIVKDMFLFCYYTGLRYSDMQKLSWNNIKNGEISIIMQKTGKPLKIDLIGKATEIINKYKKCNRDTIFEKLSNQKLNFGLKKLLHIAEIKENYTFHDSRHAFACALVAKGVALTVIRDLMGHTSIKETDKYAKVDQRQKQSAILLLDTI